MKKKYRDLSKNMILFTISSLGRKALAFFLVPFYTNFLLTEEYGQIDLVMTTVNLLIPIITINISEAVMRFTLESKGDTRYFSFGRKVTILGVLLLALLSGIIYFIPAFDMIRLYLPWVFIVITVDSLYILYQNFLRATDRIEIMVVGSLINTFVSLSLNVLFIAKFKMGFTGYYLAYILGLLVASVYMVIRGKIYLNSYGAIDGEVQIRKLMIAYSFPTIINAVAWWVNSSLDKYFVSGVCGVDQNGIYSMAYKIPTIITAFQVVFSRAWTISAIVEFDKDDKDGFFGKTFEMYSSAMVIVTSMIMLMNIFLSRLLYAGNFFSAWKYVPLLLLATYYSAMSGYLGGIFLAVKDTKSTAFSTLISALVNIILNAILINGFGVIGAAIATLVSYFTACVMRLVISERYIKLQVDWRKVILVDLLLFIQMLCATSNYHFYIVQVLVLAAIIVCYYKKYVSMIKKAVSFIRLRVPSK